MNILSDFIKVFIYITIAVYSYKQAKGCRE